jgi:hypothetical protein
LQRSAANHFRARSLRNSTVSKSKFTGDDSRCLRGGEIVDRQGFNPNYAAIRAQLTIAS